MKQAVVALVLLFFSYSCNKIYNRSSISINKMKVVVWNLACADELFNELQAKDSSYRNKFDERLKLYNKVFEINKITKEEFYSNYQQYLKNPPQLKILMDSVQAYGMREKQKPIYSPKVSVIP